MGQLLRRLAILAMLGAAVVAVGRKLGLIGANEYEEPEPAPAPEADGDGAAE